MKHYLEMMSVLIEYMVLRPILAPVKAFRHRRH
jgi:hypothetical protein